MRDRITILDVPIDRQTMDGTLSQIGSWMGEGSPTLRQICTANPEFVMRARRDAPFLAILQNADLVLADGIGLIKASRWQGAALPERVAGSDLVYHLAKQCADNGWRLFLLGAAEGVAQLAADKLCELYPNLEIAGTFSGSPDIGENDVIVDRINRSNAQVLYVAFGAPQQDQWIARNKTNLSSVMLAVGVGGSLDFISGRQKRAPQIFQKFGLEWLYRLWQEPWRWRRMMALPKFALLAFFEARAK